MDAELVTELIFHFKEHTHRINVVNSIPSSVCLLKTEGIAIHKLILSSSSDIVKLIQGNTVLPSHNVNTSNRNV